MAKVGRPKIKPSDLREDWKEFLISEMKDGASRAEIYAGLDIDKEVFSRLCQEDDEFSETVKKGLMYAKAWWLRNGRTNLENKEFNYTGWYMQMKNRFGWKDRRDITTNNQSLNKIDVSLSKEIEDKINVII